MASPPHKRLKLANSRVATLLGGSKSEEFTVHQNLLCESSDFFKAALEGQFRESVSATVKLPEDKFEVVDNSIEWLYTRRPPPFETAVLIPALSTREDSKRQYEGVIELYGFAQRVICLELKKDLFDKIFTTIQTISAQGGKRWFPLHKTIGQLYASTTAASPLRRLFVHWCCFGSNPTYWKRPFAQDALHDTPTFAVDVALILALRCSDDGKQLNFPQLTVSYFYDEDMKKMAEVGDVKKDASGAAQPQKKLAET